MWSRYYEEKGFAVILTSRVLNLLALGFSICFSTFLMLFVDWGAFKEPCLAQGTCDISQVLQAELPIMLCCWPHTEVHKEQTFLIELCWHWRSCHVGVHCLQGSARFCGR